MHLKQEYRYEQIIKKSQFIACLKPIHSEEEARNYIEEIRKEFNDATHVCTAYVCGENNMIQRSSDNKEPAGTAGVPMLEAILKSDIQDVCACVVRYFGGIKLGAGGLTRAYVDSASQTIKKSILLTKKEVEIYKINTSYELNDVLNRYFIKKSIIVIDVQYLENIEYTISCEKLDIDDLKNYMQGKIEISFLRKENILVK